ncbi:MAG: glycoside hydrolase family 125 protein [Clostridia bacterium]|nr:glycoside hydrolase family 125 protein [Clostridia bacterium]
MKIPSVLTDYADYLENKTKKTYPPLAALAKQCYLNTIETTVKPCDNGDYFVITGDIPALWLRDSSAQLRPYAVHCKDSEELCEIFRGVIKRHAFYVNLDPYSNAFNEIKHDESHEDDTDFSSPYIWERKYEVDSLCASVYLVSDYYDATSDKTIFTPELHKMFITIADTFVKEQDHAKNSSYYFRRTDCPETDTMPNDGKGNPVGITGMTWSGFRPSDDRCKYNYLIPANMMCHVAMKKAAELLITGYSDNETAEKCLILSEEVKSGIEKYGVYDHPDFGKIYAYETDGLGNFLLMDDANSPSLLSAPYLGYCDVNNKIYQNTRKFILSENNPFYFEGKAAKGIGSPHTGKDKIWHIALTMQILTSTDKNEIAECLRMLSQTHAETNFMHESFNKDDASDFTREWFAWANSLFAQMLSGLEQID